MKKLTFYFCRAIFPLKNVHKQSVPNRIIIFTVNISMDDNKKNKTKKIIRCALIVLLMLMTLYKEWNSYCKREISSWIHDFYSRENFAFDKKSDNSEFCPIRGIWLLSDLAQYKEATEKDIDSSAHDNYMAYFKNSDNSLRWDNIAKWLTDESTAPSYVECDALAELMLNMTDDDLEKVIELGQIKSSGFHKYKISNSLKKVASVFVIKTSEERRKDFPKYDFDSEDFFFLYAAETRALGFLQTVIEIDKLNGNQVSVEISSEEYKPLKFVRKCFTYKIIPEGADIFKLDSPVITAYPRQISDGLKSTLTDICIYDCYTLKSFQKSVKLPTEQFEQAIDLMIDIGLDNRCMQTSGQVVKVTRENCAIAYIADIDFYDDELFYYAKAYGVHFRKDVSPQELKEHFLKYDESFQEYNDWWYYCGQEEVDNYNLYMIFELSDRGIPYDEATLEQLEEAAKVVDKKLKEN